MCVAVIIGRGDKETHIVHQQRSSTLIKRKWYFCNAHAVWKKKNVGNIPTISEIGISTPESGMIENAQLRPGACAAVETESLQVRRQTVQGEPEDLQVHQGRDRLRGHTLQSESIQFGKQSTDSTKLCIKFSGVPHSVNGDVKSIQYGFIFKITLIQSPSIKMLSAAFLPFQNRRNNFPSQAC